MEGWGQKGERECELGERKEEGDTEVEGGTFWGCGVKKGRFVLPPAGHPVN